MQIANRDLASRRTPAAMVQGAKQLVDCMAWLSERGFKPVLADVGMYAKPVISIAHERGCEKLKAKFGAEPVAFHNAAGRQRNRWQCLILGCWVEWFEEA